MAKCKTKVKEPDYFEICATGQRYLVVEEAFYGEGRVRGFWMGEPRHSAFIRLENIADKRLITPALKRRLRAERAAYEAIIEAHRHPVTPDAETVAKDRIPPSERRSPYKWGTLAWYRNELALAQDRIRLLEGERETLLAEKWECDRVLLHAIEQPSFLTRQEKQWTAPVEIRQRAYEVGVRRSRGTIHEPNPQ
jgi:hypothetical protein